MKARIRVKTLPTLYKQSSVNKADVAPPSPKCLDPLQARQKCI
jgi:hypothetical protein